MGAYLQQRVRRIDNGVLHQRGFIGIDHRKDEGPRRAFLSTLNGERHGQRAAYQPSYGSENGPTKIRTQASFSCLRIF